MLGRGVRLIVIPVLPYKDAHLEAFIAKLADKLGQIELCRGVDTGYLLPFKLFSI